MIGGHSALDDVFTQSPNSLDDNVCLVVGNWVDTKHDPGDVGLHHLLDGNGEGYFEVIKTLLDTVVDGAWLKQAGPSFADMDDD